MKLYIEKSKRSNRKYEESLIQQAIIEESCLTFIQINENLRVNIGEYLFAIPNGGKRSAREAARLKKEGVKPGVADLFLAIPIDPYAGLFIEVKTQKGKLTLNQKQFLDRQQKIGYACVVARKTEDVMRYIQNYLTGKKIFLTE